MTESHSPKGRKTAPDALPAVSGRGTLRARKDRLLALIERLRDGKLHRASDLARAMGVSKRSLYRDMDVLRASGVPIRGERGVGYRMSAEVTLPPLNLTIDEMEALHLGVAVMTEAADPALQRAALQLAAKLDAALPESAPPQDAAPSPAPATAQSMAWGLSVFPYASAASGTRHVAVIRDAIRQGQKLRIAIAEGGAVHPGRAGDPGLASQVIWPGKLAYWGRVWTLEYWSETTERMESLRLDRLAQCTALSARIPQGGLPGWQGTEQQPP